MNKKLSIYEKVLYKYQKDAFDFLININKHMIALDMGLGKTITSLAILQKRFLDMERKIALIVCQKTKIIDWYNEVANHFQNIKILVFKSETISIKEVKKHRKRIEKDKIPKSQNGRLKLICDYYANKNVIIISSYEIARIRNDYISMVFNNSKFLTNKIKSKFAFIVDESQIMKSRFSKKGIWGEEKAREATYVSLLSGDPISNSYIDLFQQMRILGMTSSWSSWSWNFCVYNKKTSYKKEWYELIGFKKIDKLMKILKNRAVFLKTEKCIDYLPKQIWKTIYTLENFYPIEILKKFKKMNSLTFSSPSKYFLAQRELACGFLSNSTFNSNDKINIVIDLLNSTNDNFVIYYNFVKEKEKLISILVKNKRQFFQINGQKNDYKNIQNIKNKARTVLIIQYQAGSWGLNLANFNRMIFMSPTTSSGNFKQAAKRIHRIGQKESCFYYKLITPNSVEVNIAKSNELGIDYTLKMFNKDYILKNEKVVKYFKLKSWEKKNKLSKELKDLRNQYIMKKEEY